MYVYSGLASLEVVAKSQRYGVNYIISMNSREYELVTFIYPNTLSKCTGYGCYLSRITVPRQHAI